MKRISLIVFLFIVSGILYYKFYFLPQMAFDNIHGACIITMTPFNAKGDGYTDDTKALRLALELCENGKIAIPSSTYKIEREVMP